MQKCPPFCLNSVHYAYFLIQKIYTITFIVFHYGYSWFCNLPFIIIQFPFFPWNWLHTVNKDSVRDIIIKKKSHGSLTYDAGEIFWKMEVRISSVAIVLCLLEIVGNSCRNKSIKDTDTYLYDRYCITINRSCYVYF